MKKRKICVVTGTRAEYGLLYWLMKYIDNDPKLELQIIATGMHLSPEFGLTYTAIEKDGFTIDDKIEMLLSADTPSAISKSTGLGLIGFADVFKALEPDIVVLLGDRFELLSAGIAAAFSKIPIAHIHGGEITAGVFDEAIRHSITKMSWWHFVAAKEYARRVIQLGENPSRVFNVGGLGVDAIKKSKLLNINELKNNIGIQFSDKNLLVTLHPVTLEDQSSVKHCKSMLDAFIDFNDIYFIFTMPNADADGRIIKDMIDKFVSDNNNISTSFTNLGHLNYLSCMQFVDGIVGNSSSGLLEAPTFKIGTINIGDRQKGRLESDSIINCTPTKKSIKDSIEKLYSQRFQESLYSVKNPYGEGDATEKIMDVLKNHAIPETLKKEFYDL